MRGSLVAQLWSHHLILEWGISPSKNCPIWADATTLEALLLGSLKGAGHHSCPERPLLLLEVQRSSISLGQIPGKSLELLSPANLSMVGPEGCLGISYPTCHCLLAGTSSRFSWWICSSTSTYVPSCLESYQGFQLAYSIWRECLETSLSFYSSQRSRKVTALAIW